LVNTVRFGLYWELNPRGLEISGFRPEKGDQIVKELGILGVNPKGLSEMGFPRMDIAGYPTVTNGAGGEGEDEKVFGYADSLTWSKGRHVFKFGGEYRRISLFTSLVTEGTYGIFNFNGSLTGYGQSDFLLGLPYSSQRLDPRTGRTRLDNELGIYAQDSFKLSGRVTLEMGLRWDRFGAATYDDGLIYNWDPNTGNVIVPPNALKSISPLYPTNTIKVVAGKAKQEPSLRNFVPRLGITYRPFGQRTVIRGGYGIYTETLGRYARAQSGGPYEISETFFNAVQNGVPLFAFPNPFPAGSGNIPSQSISGYPLNTSNGRIHQFNLTIERQIRDTGFRLSYIGSRSRGLNYSVSINKPQPSLIPFSQSRQPYPQFVGASLAKSNGAANYDAFTFEVQRKVGQVTFDNHWTWTSNYYNTLNLENPYVPLFWNRYPSTSRHRVVINTTWNIPVGRGRRFLASAPAPVDHILGGWQLYWIAYMESGQFFSPSFSGADPSNTNSSGGLPDRICNGNFPPGQRSIDRWFDRSCFVVPPAGRFGNSGVNILEGPARHEHDLTISKNFQITERVRMTYGAAVVNLLNHANFGNPSANISAPGSVGVVGSTKSYAPNRQIMLRGHLDF
jgi:hypothetical protein